MPRKFKTYYGRLLRWIAHLRHPSSLPKDVMASLGWQVSNFCSSRKLLNLLSQGGEVPERLYKYMPREMAELAFRRCLRQDRFHQVTLCAFYLGGAWLEFSLHFDEENRLRRVYAGHQNLPNDRVEIALQKRGI